MSCGMHLEGRGGGGLCFYGMKRLREPERVRGSLRGCPQTLAWTPHSLVGPPAMEFRSKQALSLGKRTVCPRASWSSLSPTSFPPSPHSPSTLTAVILFIKIPDRETPKAKCVNKFTCPLFKRPWVLDAAGLRTLRTRCKSARLPPRVVHRRARCLLTHLKHVCSLSTFSQIPAGAGGHIHTQTLSRS